jgi:hypothetical protein
VLLPEHSRRTAGVEVERQRIVALHSAKKIEMDLRELTTRRIERKN